jgi:hypothetical protein
MQFSPFELAIHFPAQFAAEFGEDADAYILGLGFDPRQARINGVKLTIQGKRLFAAYRALLEREQRFARLKWERRIQELKARLQLTRIRCVRLRRFYRAMMLDRISAFDLRRQYRRALKSPRDDGEQFTVASERELCGSVGELV